MSVPLTENRAIPVSEPRGWPSPHLMGPWGELPSSQAVGIPYDLGRGYIQGNHHERGGQGPGQGATGKEGVMSSMDICMRKTRIPIHKRKQKEPEGGFMETDLRPKVDP